ncbi:lactonase family protein [Paenibacillus sp. YYML68]|uniref:lactonase family protein n=1 Tax=Paenibacillus sp. YYML68 TaxID=2909250 RepID=UPI002493B457|nr:lactonase family protein [Paenibacillus sp. YYML68]
MPETDKECFLYVGTYENGGADSIFTLVLNEETGALEYRSANGETEQPSFLIRGQRRDRLYGVIELQAAHHPSVGGSVSVFALDESSGALKLLQTASTEGASPCYVTLAANGKVLLAANYMSGSVSVYPVLEDGCLGPLSDVQRHEGRSITERQEAPHAHCVLERDGHVFVTDLGTDEIVRYRLELEDSRPRLVKQQSVKSKAGAGPRHLAFHPQRPFVYVMNELDNTIGVYSYEKESGEWTLIENVPSLPEDYNGMNIAAHIEVHPNGRYLYASNRGHNSIVVCDIDVMSGRLTVVQHASTLGDGPRHFAISPDVKLLVAANQKSGSLVTFRVDAQKGTLEPTGYSIEVPNPACVRFI